MWIYWKEQCLYCKNRINCEYVDNVAKLIENLAITEKSIPNTFGTLKWTCDYFIINEKDYWEHQIGEMNNDTNTEARSRISNCGFQI